MSWLFASGDQSIGDSASATALPMHIQDWISFRIDWFDLLAVQGTIKSLLQYHSSKASTLWCSAFFMAQFAHRYMTTGKTIALVDRPLLANICQQIFFILFLIYFIFLTLQYCIGFAMYQNSLS